MRLTAVKTADALQAADHVGYVGAKNAAIAVHFIQHDKPERSKKILPGGMMGQDASVEHVGIGEHQSRFAPYLGTSVLGRVAVINVGMQLMVWVNQSEHLR